MKRTNIGEKQALEHERNELLQQLEDWLEVPMLVLGFGWLVLLAVELIWGLSPFLESLTTVIWAIFILDFALRFVLAPHKVTYLKRNWLTAVSLLLPALRIFRIVRLARLLTATRTIRALRLVRVVSSLNRGMRALGTSMGRRGFGYVIALTLIISLVGAAGMYAFENQTRANGFDSYGAALWWTAMIMTTMGSQYWPQTAEGRILAFLLSLYAFTVFGYMTAALATYFIGRDAEHDQAELAGAKSIEGLRTEIAALRMEIRTLSQQTK